MTFFVWVLIILFGIACIRFRYQVYEFTGEWSWATKFLWWNGTVVAIILIGMFCIGYGTAYSLWMVEMKGPGIQGPLPINASK